MSAASDERLGANPAANVPIVVAHGPVRLDEDDEHVGAGDGREVGVEALRRGNDRFAGQIGREQPRLARVALGHRRGELRDSRAPR